MNDAEDRTPVYPLEWHPWYRDKTWLLDWLNGTSGYPSDRVKVPVLPVLTRATMENTEPEAEAPIRDVVLTKYQMAAPAPYVGRRFCYRWTVGIDNLGRGIASDSERVYLDEFPYIPRSERVP